ncbi:MAG: fatty acid desaturase [Brevundimonas sp.]|jgi:fatty acid desaturase|uniref:hypothetical protein n=1 Tax=Brevundimonas sp. TaxID=1871086 RepID=UPI0039E24F5D
MTPSPPPSIASRILDVVFGEKGTPEEAGLPPKSIRLAFVIVMGLLFAVWLLLVFGSWGWLPIDRDSIPTWRQLPTWGKLAFFGMLLLVQFAQLQVQRHYKHRADRTRMSDGGQDDQP